MTPLRQRFIDDLRLRNRSPRTIEVYVMHLKAYALHFGLGGGGGGGAVPVGC